MFKLSVIIPSFNVLPYLKKTIDSLAENTYSKFELIIVDDNSNDETKRFLHEIEDVCTVVFNNKQKYVTSNWNTGIKLSHGEYIAILNNDIVLPKDWDKLLINNLNDEVWITSPYLTDTISATPFTIDDRFPNINISGPCFMLKKKTFDTIGFFPEEMKIWYNDVWLSWIVTKVYKKKSIYIPDVVVHHFKSKSTENMSENYRHKFVEMVNEDMMAFNKIKEDYQKQKKYTPVHTILV